MPNPGNETNNDIASRWRKQGMMPAPGGSLSTSSGGDDDDDKNNDEKRKDNQEEKDKQNQVGESGDKCTE